MAANRLTELERLQRQHEEKVAECAKLSMQVCAVTSPHTYMHTCIATPTSFAFVTLDAYFYSRCLVGAAPLS